MSTNGLSRVLNKLEAAMNSGEYYEAHQMYRTLYFRYLNQKKHLELLNLLYNGSTRLLQSGQQGSGADLGILLIDVLNKSETEPNEEWCEKIAKLFELISPGIPERETFLINSVKWSMDSKKSGHVHLHKKIAEVFWKEGNFSSAHKHFLRSNDSAGYAKLIIEQHTAKGVKSETDMYITQGVLRLLCLRKIDMAADTFTKYTTLHPMVLQETGPQFPFPLLNFIWFLLRAIRELNGDQFKLLKDWYSISLQRDPTYSSYLERIERLYFSKGTHLNQCNSNSMIGGLLKTILGEVESSDEDSELAEDYPNMVPDLD